LSTPNELLASLAEHLQPSALVAPKRRPCTGGPSRPFSYAWLARMRGSQQPDLSSRRSLAPPPGCRGPTCGDPVTGAATALFVSSRRMSDPHSQHRGRLPLWRDVKLFGDECTAAGTLRSLRQARWRGTSKGGARGPPGARGSPSRSVGKC
jgi:hypothetical protein